MGARLYSISPVTSLQPLEVFKPPPNLTMMNENNDAGMIEPNEKFTHNTQTNIHPTNYTQLISLNGIKL